MSSQMAAVVEAIEARASGDDFLALKIPETYRGITTHRDEISLFDGVPPAERDPRRTLHLDDVPVPTLHPGEALLAVMASSVNYNTIWSSIFEPHPTFEFFERYGRRSAAWKRHDLPYHVLGSDAAGVVLRVGPGVNRWKPGDRVTCHASYVDLEEPEGYDDAMLDPACVGWGWETNFGGLGELAVAKANQLMPKPEHLTWEESGCCSAAGATAYRQLVSHNGAAMKQGDVVLIWGASTGIGSFATQYALNGGAYPIGVVSSPERAALLRRMGCEWIIDRKAEGYPFWDGDQVNQRGMVRFRSRIRKLTGGEYPHIVFEHPGRETFATSVLVARRGGTIVTCASTSGYEHVFDNRYLWTNLKRILGTHIANYLEAWEANRLICMGAIHPTLSCAFPLERCPEAVRQVQQNLHCGKVGVLCLAGREGLGVLDPELREKHIDKITLFRTERAGGAEA